MLYEVITSADMWKHAWLASEAHFAERFDISVLLEPTSPLRRPEDITSAVEALLEKNCDAAATVSRAAAHFTPHKCLTLDENGIIGFVLPSYRVNFFIERNNFV